MHKDHMSEGENPPSQHLPSKHSLTEKKELENSRESPRSQKPLPHALEESSPKKRLLMLMAEVKLDEFGFSGPDVIAFLSQHLQERPQSSLNTKQFGRLSGELTQVFVVNYLTQIFGREIRVQIRRRDNLQQDNYYSFNIPPALSHSRQNLQPDYYEQMKRQQQKRPVICSICCHEGYSSTTQLCGHSFCDSCMRDYIKQSIREGNYSINCPEYRCPHLLSKKTVKQLLKPRQYDRFQYFHDKNEKELNPQNKFCSRPDCGQVLNKEKDVLVCPKCRQRYCEVCLQKDHQGKECDEVLRQTLEHTYKEYQIKKCPKCKSPIEKQSGCNHMTCKKCKYEFCWICSKEYSDSHFRFYNLCGCPGMMFMEEGAYCREKIKQICICTFLPVFIVLLLTLYILSLPLFMIIMFFCKSFQWMKQSQDRCETSLSKKMFSCEGCFCHFFYSLTSYLLLIPRSLLYAIFKAPCQITEKWCRMF